MDFSQRQSVIQTMRQEQVMTHQQIQALEMLFLPVLELQALVDAELEKNPILKLPIVRAVKDQAALSIMVLPIGTMNPTAFRVIRVVKFQNQLVKYKVFLDPVRQYPVGNGRNFEIHRMARHMLRRGF